MENERKRIIFDPAFAADVKDICVNGTPAGSAPEDFGVTEGPEYGVLTYGHEKEAQALEILFIAVGRAWLAAKRRVSDCPKIDGAVYTAHLPVRGV